MNIKTLPYLSDAALLAQMKKDEFITPEHILAVMINRGALNIVAERIDIDLVKIEQDLEEYFEEISYSNNRGFAENPELSNSLCYAMALLDKFKFENGMITDGGIFEAMAKSESEYLGYCFDCQEISVDTVSEILYENEEENEPERREDIPDRDMAGNVKNWLNRKSADLNRFDGLTPREVSNITGIPEGDLRGGMAAGGFFINGKGPLSALEASKIMGIPEQELIAQLKNSHRRVVGADEIESELEEFRESQSEKEDDTLKYCEYLNEKELERFVGREDLIEKTLKILCKKRKNNVLYLGEPGVGKTALINGLVENIKAGRVSEDLKDAKVYSVDLPGMVSGSKFRGEFEAKLTHLLNKASKSKTPTILYIDEAHTLIGAGNGQEAGMDASNILKPYMSNGKIRFIGSTTYEEYQKTIGKDKAFNRRFTSIFVDEPSRDDTINIVKELITEFSDYHNIKYSDDAVEIAVDLSIKYIKDKKLPDKAIDLIDESGVYAKLNSKSLVDKEVIEEVMYSQYKIPRQEIGNNETLKLKMLSSDIKKVVFGQDEAVDKIVNRIQYHRAGLSSPNEPVGGFIAVGPTGVGKTELAKTIASTLGLDLVRFDMSEYKESHSISKLIGSPPGYVGHSDGGLLVTEIRKHPNSVLLIDEMEKAHPDIMDTLLQVLDNAVLTDGVGNKADFRNVLIIMTSNAGAKDAKESNPLGFNTCKDDKKAEVMKKALEEYCKPEFLARLTGVLEFNSISNEMAIEITRKKLELFNERISDRGIRITYSDELVDYLALIGIDSNIGARGLQRVIDDKVGDKLKDLILFGDLKAAQEIKVSLTEDNEVSVK